MFNFSTCKRHTELRSRQTTGPREHRTTESAPAGETRERKSPVPVSGCPAKETESADWLEEMNKLQEVGADWRVLTLLWK